jgi:hypothetical protein
MTGHIAIIPLLGTWGSLPSCDIEDRTNRALFYRSGTEMRKAPGSSGGGVQLPGQAYKVAQRRNVGVVRSDPCAVHRQAESLGDFRVDPSVVEFTEAEADRRQDTVCARRSHGPWRRKPLPTVLRYVVELLPIVLAPHRSPLFSAKSIETTEQQSAGANGKPKMDGVMFFGI